MGTIRKTGLFALCGAILMTAGSAIAAPLSFSIDRIALVNSSDLSNILQVIDTFDTAHGPVDTTTSPTSHWDQVAAPEAIGGTRIIDLGLIGGGQPGGDQTMDVSGGSLNYTGVDPTTAGFFRGRIIYQGGTFSAPGNVTGGLGGDLTAGGAANGFLVDITAAANTSVSLSHLSIDTGGFLPNGSSTASVTATGTQSIFLQFNGIGTTDATVSQFSFSATEVAPVPLPAGVVLMIGGIAALAGLRMRKSAHRTS